MEDVIIVHEKYTQCRGKSPALGHPKVFLDVLKKGSVACPYCGQRFVYQDKNEVHG